MKTYDSIIDLIGNTPLVRLHKIETLYNLKSRIYAKVEMFNPSHSIKARIAKNMLLKALEEKVIDKDTVIIEPTSGNTGVGLAMICASLGMKFIAVMPENMSSERIKLIKAYGSEIVLTAKGFGMKGAVEKAEALHQEIKNSFIPLQFSNIYNPLAHYETTAKEIYDDLDGNVDVIVCGIGTGGTISGVAKFLKEKNKDILSVGLEPESSPLLTKKQVGPHKIQGIGANFIPDTLDLSFVDEVIDITNEEAFEYARILAKVEGIFAGISSGCALCGAVKKAKALDDKNIVVVLPDTGERYLSTDLID